MYSWQRRNDERCEKYFQLLSALWKEGEVGMKLKPCPFCGNPNPVYWCYPKDDKSLFTDRWAVLCYYSDGGCGAEGSHQKSKEEAANAWNERKQEIVRCKDCKFWYKDECSHLCKITGDLHPANWFCANGERKCESD